MKRGVLLFAHNNGVTDYYSMAVYTANRINRFLDLPVSLVSDLASVKHSQHVFDKIIYVHADESNIRDKNTKWINKGRHSAFEHTPYDETLLLDTDYMINSTQLLETFSYYSDMVCHNITDYVLNDAPQEFLSRWSAQSLWATVVRFRKTTRVEQVFNMMSMIQNNYEHYSNIHKFQPYTYRNDYALTIALRTVNGHIEDPRDYLHWKLLHVDLNTKIHRVDDTKYIAIRANKPRSDWVYLNNIDFHMLNKTNFMELTHD